MIDKLRKWIVYKWDYLQNMVHKHGEYLGIIVALLILLIFPGLIRQIDPSAAPIDPGILSGIVLAIVAVLIFNSVTWWLIRVIWPVFADYSNSLFISDFKSLAPCQRVLIYLGFFLFFVIFHLIALIAIV
jgi:hypothetical protein